MLSQRINNKRPADRDSIDERGQKTARSELTVNSSCSTSAGTISTNAPADSLTTGTSAASGSTSNISPILESTQACIRTGSNTLVEHYNSPRNSPRNAASNGSALGGPGQHSNQTRPGNHGVAPDSPRAAARLQEKYGKPETGGLTDRHHPAVPELRLNTKESSVASNPATGDDDGGSVHQPRNRDSARSRASGRTSESSKRQPVKVGGLYDMLPPPDPEKDKEAGQRQKDKNSYASGEMKRACDPSKVMYSIGHIINTIGVIVENDAQRIHTGRLCRGLSGTDFICWTAAVRGTVGAFVLAQILVQILLGKKKSVTVAGPHSELLLWRQ